MLAIVGGVAGRGNPTNMPDRTNILDACFFALSKKKDEKLHEFATCHFQHAHP